MPSRARNGRRRVASSGCIGPALVHATVGQVTEDAVEVDGRSGRDEPVRQRVQPQVGVGRRHRAAHRGRSRRRRRRRSTRAARVGDREPVELVGRHRRIEAERDPPCRGRREPRVEHRAVRRGRGEADAPHPPLRRSCLHAYRTGGASVAAVPSLDSGDAAARPVRDLRRSHPDHLRHPERLRRREPSSPTRSTPRSVRCRTSRSTATATRSSPAPSSAARSAW